MIHYMHLFDSFPVKLYWYHDTNRYLFQIFNLFVLKSKIDLTPMRVGNVHFGFYQALDKLQQYKYIILLYICQNTKILVHEKGADVLTILVVSALTSSFLVGN